MSAHEPIQGVVDEPLLDDAQVAGVSSAYEQWAKQRRRESAIIVVRYARQSKEQRFSVELTVDGEAAVPAAFSHARSLVLEAIAQSMKDAAVEISNSALNVFLAARCEIAESIFVPVDVLRDEWICWYADQGLEAPRGFVEALRKRGFNQNRYSGVPGSAWVFEGIALRREVTA